MLLLHVSDTHLGSSRPGKLRERELDYYDVFNEVVDIAVRERVDAIIHGGDFFDEPKPSPQTYLYAYRALGRLREHGIDLLVVAGQHDQPKVAQLPPLRVLSEMGLLRLLAQDKPETHIVKLHSGELGVTAIPYLSPVIYRGAPKDYQGARDLEESSTSTLTAKRAKYSGCSRFTSRTRSRQVHLCSSR